MHISISNLYNDLSSQIESLKSDKSSVTQSRKIVEEALQKDEPFYGINTGFGILANQRIEKDQVRKLQRNLILSHSVGVGDLVPKAISRLMLKLKIHALALGNSGVSEQTFDRLIYFRITI